MTEISPAGSVRVTSRQIVCEPKVLVRPVTAISTPMWHLPVSPWPSRLGYGGNERIRGKLRVSSARCDSSCSASRPCENHENEEQRMRAELRASQVAPGAVMEVEGRARRVVGSLHFVMADTRWSEHCLESTPGPPEWLSIRPRGGLTVVHWTPRYDLFGEPDHRRRDDSTAATGRSRRSGHAHLHRDGDTGTGARGHVRLRRVRRGRRLRRPARLRELRRRRLGDQCGPARRPGARARLPGGRRRPDPVLSRGCR